MPIPPQSASKSPSSPITIFVTSPVSISATPKDRIIGIAVGDGSSTVPTSA